MTDLLLAYDFPPIGGGIARWMAEIARRYPAGGLVVSTGSLPAAADGQFPNRVDRIAVPSGRLRTLPGLWAWRRRVRSLVAAHTVQFVWCGNLRPAGYVAARTRQRDGIPYGVLLHGGDLLQLRAKFTGSALKRHSAKALLANASVLVANSGWTAELVSEIMTTLGLDPADRVRVVPLGSDPAVFRPGLDSETVRARHQIEPGRVRLLTVARLVPHKGIDAGIAAVAALRDRIPGLTYLVVGRGPDRARLEALAQSLGVGSAVQFADGVSDADLPAVYGTSDLYLGLSRADGLEVEGFGIALADAAASGLAVVAGRSGGTGAAVLDGETGILVDARDPAAVAGAVATILGDSTRRHQLGEAGRRWVERDRNWDRVVRDLQAISRSAATVGPR